MALPPGAAADDDEGTDSSAVADALAWPVAVTVMGATAARTPVLSPRDVLPRVILIEDEPALPPAASVELLSALLLLPAKCPCARFPTGEAAG